MSPQIDGRTPTEVQQDREPSIPAAAGSAPSESSPQTSALTAVGQFLRDSWIAAVAVSAAVLVPCFWHQRIEAGDLASHTYNAWLAQLIDRGQAPGLSLANQWNNVLFDLSLNRAGDLIGLRAAEKLCVSIAVLIFFWGAFAMIGAIARRATWSLVPCIAMLAYGWTFQQGFMNYYISVGLAFFGVALLHRGNGLERALIALVLPLAWIAHPLGVAILVGLGLYVTVAAAVPAARQVILAVVAAVLMVVGILWATHHYIVAWPSEGYLPILLSRTGADQLVLYGQRYWVPAGLFMALALLWVAIDAPVRRKQSEGRLISSLSLPLQLYGLAWFAGVLLPMAIVIPGYAAPLGLLGTRLTSVTGVMACCVLGVVKPQRWHAPCALAIAAVFFFFSYQDTGKLNRMEEQAERYERVLPPGQRILGTIWPFRGSRVLINHIIDRACIGQCFSYGNYEPSSGQFRVRAQSKNAIVFSDRHSADAAQTGVYLVRTDDLPLFEIYQCNLNMTELCMRELTAGESNGAVGIRPVEKPDSGAAAQTPLP